jgi:hypothetical protein
MSCLIPDPNFGFAAIAWHGGGLDLIQRDVCDFVHARECGAWVVRIGLWVRAVRRNGPQAAAHRWPVSGRIFEECLRAVPWANDWLAVIGHFNV